MRRITLLALAMVACLNPNEASANLVLNGGFEDPAIPKGTYSYLPSIPGWTLASGPAIEIQNHVAGSPYQGNQFVELDSSGNSSMYQDLTTVAGDAYKLTFAYSPRPGVAANSNGIDVFWNGGIAPILSLAQSGVGLNDTMWTVYTLNLTATTNITRLQFTATGISDTYGGYIDAVSVDAVPEPATLGMGVIAAVAGLMVHRRRKQFKSDLRRC